MKENDIKDNFSAKLRACLEDRYGKIPSASVVARDFNLRAYGSSTISQESARRWIKGMSLPEEDRLRVLVNWLKLDFNEVLRNDNNLKIGDDTQLPAYFDQQLKQDARLTNDDAMLALLKSLNQHQRVMLLNLIKIIFPEHPVSK